MAFVRGRTSFEERFVEAIVPLSAPSLTAGSISGRLAWAVHDFACSHATETKPSAREARGKEENS